MICKSMRIFVHMLYILGLLSVKQRPGSSLEYTSLFLGEDMSQMEYTFTLEDNSQDFSC